MRVTVLRQSRVSSGVIVSVVALLLAACSAEPPGAGNLNGSNDSDVVAAPRSLEHVLEVEPERLLIEPVAGPLLSEGADDPVARLVSDLDIDAADQTLVRLTVAHNAAMANNGQALIPARSDGQCPGSMGFAYETVSYTAPSDGWYVSRDGYTDADLTFVEEGEELCLSRPIADHPTVPELEGSEVVGSVSASISVVGSIDDCYAVLDHFPAVRWEAPVHLAALNRCRVSGWDVDEATLQKLADDGRLTGVGRSLASMAEATSADAIRELEREIRELERDYTQWFDAGDARRSTGGVGFQGTELIVGGGPIRSAERGKGVLAYVIDDGVNARHPELGASLESLAVPGADPSEYVEAASLNPCIQHGTHVAGLVVGRRTGVASGARMVRVSLEKYCDETDEVGFIIAPERGIEWVLNDVERIKDETGQYPLFVVNYSLGWPYFYQRHSPDSLPEQMQVLDRLRDAGGVFVKSAGNDAANACSEQDILRKQFGDRAVIVGALQTKPESFSLIDERAERRESRFEESLSEPEYPKNPWEGSDAVPNIATRWMKAYKQTLQSNADLEGKSLFALPRSGSSSGSSMPVPLTMSFYSNYGPCIDIWANGAAYSTSAFHGNPFITGAPNYTYMNGTSMAAPLVAGAAAAWLAREGRPGDARNKDRFLAAAQASAIPLTKLLAAPGVTERDITEVISTGGALDESWKAQGALHLPSLLGIGPDTNLLPRMGIAEVAPVIIDGVELSGSRRVYVQDTPSQIAISGHLTEMFPSDAWPCMGSPTDANPPRFEPVKVSLSIDGQPVTGTAVGCLGSDSGNRFFAATTFIRLAEPVGQVTQERENRYRAAFNPYEPLWSLTVRATSAPERGALSETGCYFRDLRAGTEPGCYLADDANVDWTAPLYTSDRIPRFTVSLDTYETRLREPRVREQVALTLESVWESISRASVDETASLEALPEAGNPCRGSVDCREVDPAFLTNESVADRIGLVAADENACGGLSPWEIPPTSCGVAVRVASGLFNEITEFSLPQVTTPIEYLGVVDVFNTPGTRRQLVFEMDGLARGRYLQVIDFVEGEFVSVTPPQADALIHQPLPASDAELTVWGNSLGATYGTHINRAVDALGAVTWCSYMTELTADGELFETEISVFGVVNDRWVLKEGRNWAFPKADLPSECSGGFFESGS